MLYMGAKVSDLVRAKVITKQEKQWIDSGMRIPHGDTAGLWIKMLMLQAKVREAIDGGVVEVVKQDPCERRAAPYISGDYMGEGVNGLMSMADGKYYDSKSAYRRSLKEKGLIELGTDAPSAEKARPLEAKYCDTDLKRDIKQAIELLGG